MPAFHCPVGAAYYKSEHCIMCGMCQAVTTEEKVRATEIIRSYLQNKGNERYLRYCIKKIAVCGKGGVGKSTVVASMAFALEKMGYRVLVVDTDASNPGLYRKLGIKRMPKSLISTLPRFAEGCNDVEWMRQTELSINDIPKEYRVDQSNIEFMMTGKIENPLQGCACVMGESLKELLGKLTVYENEIVIIDNEAGVESFGRGIEQEVDSVITVAEPSYDSLELAKTIQYMSQGIGIRRVRTIINKVPDEITEILKKTLKDNAISYLGFIPESQEIKEKGFLGVNVASTDIMPCIQKIVTAMLDEAEMPYL